MSSDKVFWWIAAATVTFMTLAGVGLGAAIVEHRAASKAFAFEVGGCVWEPPSPHAAATFLAWFYGLGGVDTTYVNYEAALAASLARSMSEQQAASTVRWLEGCFGAYQTPPALKGPQP